MADKETKLGSVTFTWRGDAVAAAVRDGAWDGLVRAGNILKKSMAETVGVAGGFGNRSAPGQPPKKDQNQLAGSMTSNPDPAARVVRVGTNVPHGRYMEFGANVRPKKGKFLPVPLNKQAADLLRNATKKGGLRNSGKNLVVVPTKGGGFVLVERTAKKGRRKKNGAAFALVKNVRILPRPWVKRSLYNAIPEMRNVYAEAIRQAVRRAVKG